MASSVSRAGVAAMETRDTRTSITSVLLVPKVGWCMKIYATTFQIIDALGTTLKTTANTNRLD